MSADSSKSKSKYKLQKPVEFEFFAPHAHKVGVGATFNGWDSSKNPLEKGKDGKWRATFMLPPGRHQYRYSVDGDWQNDQRPVECVPNEFGTWNCVVEVK